MSIPISQFIPPPSFPMFRVFNNIYLRTGDIPRVSKYSSPHGGQQRPQLSFLTLHLSATPGKMENLQKGQIFYNITHGLVLIFPHHFLLILSAKDNYCDETELVGYFVLL